MATKKAEQSRQCAED